MFGEQELIAHLARGGTHQPGHCISIGNPDETIPAIIRDNFRSILELRFYDAEEVEQLGAGVTKRVPEPRDVKGVIEFFRLAGRSTTGYPLFTAGRASPGLPRLPWVSCTLFTGSEEEAAFHLKRIRRTPVRTGTSSRFSTINWEAGWPG